MSTDHFDLVIVGAGLMGSSAAYHASKKGARVLLLEQFSFLHMKGSSHGRNRIFRVAYSEPIYTKLCLDSLEMWKQLEKESNVELIEMTGGLDYATTPTDNLDQVGASLATHKVPYERLSGSQVNERFPGFTLPSSGDAIYTDYAGVLNPDLAMKTLQTLAEKQGATLRDNTSVQSVKEGEDGFVAVELVGGQVMYGTKCIITAGSWASRLLPNANVSLQPRAVFGTFWTCPEEHKDKYTPNNFPIFINAVPPYVYGMPSASGVQGVKICLHDGPNVDPDKRPGVKQAASDVDKLRSVVRKDFAHLLPDEPCRVDDCLYTMTPDENFIVDFVPERGRKVVVGAGFSGHGAKMTPVIGEMLVQLALDGSTPHATDLFRIDRPSFS